MSAQRLSASKIISLSFQHESNLIAEVLNAFRHQRSFHLLNGCDASWKQDVLNAFRHQRSFHFCTSLDMLAFPGAQRLSASKIISPRSCSPTKLPTRAQRLSASKIISRSQVLQGCAERHWCSTPFGIKDHFTYVSQIQGRQVSKCSTPFGIKDHFTAVLCGCLLYMLGAQRLSASKIISQIKIVTKMPVIFVLNAFRHQRSFHSEGIAGINGIIRCSTPFGIKDHFTFFQSLELKYS